MSRDDAGRFLLGYVRQGILPRDPFTSLDLEGVGRLIELGTTLGRTTRPDLKVGICGEHGGDPDSIAFFAEGTRLRQLLTIPGADSPSRRRPCRTRCV